MIRHCWMSCLLALAGSPLAAQTYAAPGTRATRIPSSAPAPTTFTGSRLSPDRMDDMPAPTVQLRDAMPTSVSVTWNALPDASGFLVVRSDGGQVTPTPLPPGTTAFLHSAANDFRQSYQYRVVALYPNGHSGPSAWIPFQPPPPVNPAWVKAELQGKDVVVSWAAVPGATRYAVAGPAGSMFRDVAAPATSVTYQGLAAGSYEIAVGARFDPGPVETPAAEWRRDTVTVAVTSGRYRVVLNGAQVVAPTRDDMLSRDGKGDEVYFSSLVEVFDRGSAAPKRKHRLYAPNLGPNSQLALAVYGDVSGGFNNRLRAGSLSPQGGLGAGDVIPLGANIFAPYAPAQAASLPMVLWEGVLNDGREALLVHPAVIEWDGGNGTSEAFPSSKCPPDQLFDAPAVQQELTRSGIGAPIVEPIRHVFTQCQRPLEMKYPDAISGIAVDREVGPIAGNNDPNAHISVDTYVVLTREKIEATLGGRPWAMLRVDRADRFDGGDGQYALYLLVERLP
jgi:hypothetical protein